MVVVCSARSGKDKQTGTTNRLIRAANDALKPGSKEYLDIVAALLEDHLAVAVEMIHNDEIRQELEDDIRTDCEKLKSFLEAAQIINEISPRSKDIIIGVGEKLSCRIVAAVLQDRVSEPLACGWDPSNIDQCCRMSMLNLCLLRVSLIVISKSWIKNFTIISPRRWLRLLSNAVTRFQLLQVNGHWRFQL